MTEEDSNKYANYEPPLTPYENPCCCGCTLQEGVGWIGAIELIWGLLNAIVAIAYLVMSQNAAKKENDTEWKKFGEDHHIGLIVVICLHVVEMVLAAFLLITASKRNRECCFAWIGGIVVVFIVELALTIYDPFSLAFAMVGINPLRIYFAFIVWSLATEIRKFPRGPPLPPPTKSQYEQMQYQNYQSSYPRQAATATTTIIDRPMAVYGASPLVLPSYGYGGYPYGYGMGGYGYGGGLGLYGHPYGYGGYYGGYGADAALLGVGLGAGLALGGGWGGGYGCGYYDDCFF